MRWRLAQASSGHGPCPARSDGRDRRLQGLRARAAARQARARRRAARSRPAPSGSSPRRRSARSRAGRRGDDVYLAPHARRPARRRAVHGEHARQARARPRRQRARPRRRSPTAGRCSLAPAMNPRMWAHPATRANAETLRARGVELVGPDEGETAEGELGVGRMAEPDEIAARRRGAAGRRRLARAASACSSPRAARASRSTRFATSATARRAGWASRSPPRRAGAGRESSLLAANLAVPAPAGVEVVATPTAADLDARGRRARRRRPTSSCMAAAVADYRPARAARGEAPEERRAVDARARADRPTSLAAPRRAPAARAAARRLRRRPRRATGLERKRRHARTRKNADLVVYNDVSRADIGFDAADNEVALVSAAGERHARRRRRRRRSPRRSSTRWSGSSADPALPTTDGPLD